MRVMRAISVYPRWAAAIASGQKSIEVRSWSTKHRGPLLICASNKPAGDLPAGCAVCVVDLIDCREYRVPEDDGAACCEGEGFAWVLSDPRPVEQVAIKGQCKLYHVDDHLVRVLTEQSTA